MKTGLDFKSAQFDQLRGEAEQAAPFTVLEHLEHCSGTI
jgi:hypothetical protein